jgi:hypothetical protein
MTMKTLALNSISLVLLGGVLSLTGCGGEGTPQASVSGIAWGFTLPGQGGYDLIANATISVLERPELSARSNSDGEFTIEGIPVGSQATFVLEHEHYPLTYTKTHTIQDTIDNLTFQVPGNGLYSVIEIQLGITSDPDKCQMVSTFTRFGRTIGDSGHHGEPGAIVTLDVPEDAALGDGPIYFGDNVLPDRNRTYSSLDGGMLIINSDPGDYLLTASCVSDPEDMAAFLEEYPPEDYPDESLRCQTEDVQFEPVLMKCRAGVFLNASPSYGLQALPPQADQS